MKVLKETAITAVVAIAAATCFTVPAFSAEIDEKCVADAAELGAADVDSGCVCFVEETQSSGLEDEYLAVDIASWVDDASEELQAIGVKCFPDL